MAALIAGATLGLAPEALADQAMRSLGYGLQQGLNAMQIACLYSLLAVAYSLIHGVTGRIILSFGDIAMFGAFYICYTALLALLTGWPAAAALTFVFVAGAAGTAALGDSLQRGVFSPLIRAPSQAIMIASIGVAILLQEAMRLQSGGREQWLPPFASNALVAGDLGGFSIRITAMQTVTFLLAVALLGGLGLILKTSRAGRYWRACTQNRALAELCGINVARVTRLTALASAFFAAASGWILAVSYGGVSFYMGLVLGLKALFASIIGGFGTIGGAVAGGIALAALETGWTALFPIIYRDVAVFLVIILLLVLKPEGLLGVAVRRDSEV
ncbi:MAG: branched-chain amino acid ABC transporter permease [Rhizobiales bacterium]|nr:branched-chain amino acid ABC transporter permease [Hyphomicrobiales bacterium]